MKLQVALTNNITAEIEINISVQLTFDQKCALLFNINQPFEVSLEEFDNNWWSLVSNIWIRFAYRNLNNGNSWKSYTCCFMKHNQLSTRKEEILIKKCRKTNIRSPNLCFAKIKVS